MSHLALFAVFICFHVSLVAASPFPQQVIPVTVPAGHNATLHNTSNVFCVTPAPWFSGIGIFYLGNYAAHAATLITYPGEAPVYIAAAILYALFFPSSGITRGLNAIFRGARFYKDDLQAAARAGALCMVVRSATWEPKTKIEKHSQAKWRVIEGTWAKEMPQAWPFFDTSLERPKPHVREPQLGTWKQLWKDIRTCNIRTERKIHGRIVLPRNGAYALAYVPRNALVRGFDHVYKDDSCVEEGPTTSATTRNSAQAKSGVETHDYAASNGFAGQMHAGAPAGDATSSSSSPDGSLAKEKDKAMKTSNDRDGGVNTTLSSSYSVVRTIIAVIQILYASFTVYKSTSGPQIRQYGYAAFGLTVIPYLIMSFVNLIGNLFTPNYDAIYVVHSSVLAEAKREYPDEVIVDGAVGELVEDEDPVAHVLVQEALLARAMTIVPVRSNTEESSASAGTTYTTDSATPNGAPSAAPLDGERPSTETDASESIEMRTFPPDPKRNPPRETAVMIKPTEDNRGPAVQARSSTIDSAGRAETQTQVGEAQPNRPRRKRKRSETEESGSSKVSHKEDRLDTSLDVIHEFPRMRAHPKWCVVFSCPKIRRTDKVPNTLVLEANLKTRGMAYFAPENRAETRIPWYTYLIFVGGSLFVGLLSLIPYGVLSHFTENDSTHPQRVWTMVWLGSGLVIGTTAGFWSAALEFRGADGAEMSGVKKAILKLLPFLFVAPGVGGLVVVGQMLREYGNCVNLF